MYTFVEKGGDVLFANRISFFHIIMIQGMNLMRYI